MVFGEIDYAIKNNNFAYAYRLFVGRVGLQYSLVTFHDPQPQKVKIFITAYVCDNMFV